MAKAPEDGTDREDGDPGRLDESLREELKKQVRHPYITGQGLEPPHDRDRQQAGRDNPGSDTSNSAPVAPESPDPSDSPDP